jgi:hypothetical protein
VPLVTCSSQFAQLLTTEPASAIVTVGPAGSGCRFTKIQDAINLVLNNERFHPDDTDPFIGVSGDNFYNEALVIDRLERDELHRIRSVCRRRSCRSMATSEPELQSTFR